MEMDREIWANKQKKEREGGGGGGGGLACKVSPHAVAEQNNSLGSVLSGAEELFVGLSARGCSKDSVAVVVNGRRVIGHHPSGIHERVEIVAVLSAPVVAPERRDGAVEVSVDVLDGLVLIGEPVDEILDPVDG